MKIDQNNGLNRIDKPKAESTYAADRAYRNSESSSLSGISGKDHATLSEEAKALARARTQMDETTEIRQERVDQLRQQIESGNYQIPLEEVVKRLVKQVKME